MKILFLDIETLPAVVHVWGLFNQYIATNQIVSSGRTACWSAKWEGQEEIMHSSLATNSHKSMIKKIHGLLDEADIVVTYNGQKFDIPTLQKEFVTLGLTPPSPFKQVDLYKVVKKNFKFQSNKLEYVVKELKIGQKIKTIGHQLWVDCMNGDKDAWLNMEEYNKNDVKILEPLFLRLLPWINITFNCGHNSTGVNADYIGSGRVPSHVCPTCGSDGVVRRGKQYTSTLVYQRYHCKACGTWSRSTKAEPKENDLLVKIT